VTTEVALGTIVLAVPFRHPGLLAKIAATITDISGGRLILGLGAGWHPEFESFGYPMDARTRRFEEGLEVIKRLLSDKTVTYQGRWLTLKAARLIPPLGPFAGRIPIIIGARRPRMLRATARHATAWNTAWFQMPDETFEAQHAELIDACREVGRDPTTMRFTVGVVIDNSGAERRAGLPGDPAVIAEALRAWEVRGAEHVVLNLTPSDLETLRVALAGIARFRSAA
jgi:alkanesulfonate monooxygenase SsuD/methylene tetrahydromethanopterin reductase-like flavin-dependent oxidoreductase (luciferase family)